MNKKSIFLFAAGLGLVVSASGQEWSYPTNGSAYFQGHIGIGANAPANKLHIAEESQTEFLGTDNGFPTSNLLLQGTASSRTVGQGPSITFAFPADSDGSNSWAQARILATPDNTNNNNAIGRLYFQVRDMYNPGCGGSWNWRTGIMIAGNGNVGIGTTSPSAKLHVEGDTYLGTNQLQFLSASGGANRIQSFGGGGIYGTWLFKSRFDHIIIDAGENSGNERQIFIRTGGADRVTINTIGNVGVGTTSPEYPLDVVGIVRAHKMKVNTQKTADFVFESNYQLPALKDMEEYVKTHKHLPGIEPASSMLEKGTDLGDFQIDLLQKIEELMLYAIAQNKKIETLEQQALAAQQQQQAIEKHNELIAALEKRIKELEAGKNN